MRIDYPREPSPSQQQPPLDQCRGPDRVEERDRFSLQLGPRPRQGPRSPGAQHPDVVDLDRHGPVTRTLLEHSLGVPQRIRYRRPSTGPTDAKIGSFQTGTWCVDPKILTLNCLDKGPLHLKGPTRIKPLQTYSTLSRQQADQGAR